LKIIGFFLIPNGAEVLFVLKSHLPLLLEHYIRQDLT
jgi:hypothetical protein